jgi:predicted enzyme related to lactoylglutathione lyase
MPKRESYVEGTPNWVDLQTTDQQAAKEFYGAIFGWEFDDAPMDDESGAVYSMAKKGDGFVGAIAPQSPEVAAQGAPPFWNTYIAVDDVDAAIDRVKDAGGQVMMEPFDVMESGRMAVAVDPTGAVFLPWQAKEHIGATLVNEPGAFIWSELITDDADSAIPFYKAVVGLDTQTEDMGGQPYTLLKVGEDTIGGTVPPMMEGIPNHWHVWFAVEDANATAEQAAGLGATLLHGPEEMMIGTVATISDPQGGVFSIIAPKAPEEGASEE